jgi:type VI protein secretion system component Hcp
MDQSKTDLVMKFVQKGIPVWAESTLDIENDDLMKEFTKNADYDFFTNFFDVSNFEMSLALKDEDQSNKPASAQSKLAAPNAKGKANSAGPYARWRSATPQQYPDIKFPLEFDKFSFQRIIDFASPVFFESCCTSTEFDSAVLVKRVSQGGSDVSAKGFLRIDFTKVLIIAVNWDDGDLITEKCDFICQGMTVTYKHQKADGSFAGTHHAQWPTDRSLSILKNQKVV